MVRLCANCTYLKWDGKTQRYYCIGQKWNPFWEPEGECVHE